MPETPPPHPTTAAAARRGLSWRDGLLELLFPGVCLACETTTPGSPFCEPCRRELLESAVAACPRCAMPVGPSSYLDGGCFECRGRSLGFDAALALGPYQGPIRAACLGMKQRQGAWMAPWLADLVIERHVGRLREDERTRVVPIPLHWRRHWSRGHNQAEALARRIANRLGLSLVHALRRIVPTPALANVGRQRRAEWMRNAFRGRLERSIRGRPVLLVDDILTTGATCGAAARALKAAGATRVTAVVVARAEGLA